MKDLYSKIEALLHEDHHYMTLGACRCLPESQRQLIKREAGLLIRYFCELPDCGWPIFGTLGEWEIDNHFSYDIRRDLNVSSYLDWNPVANTGERFGHDTAGSRIAIPFLLEKAVTTLQAGKLRDGLALAGAACHYFQDAVTFPEQQTLHRRSMSSVLKVVIDGYEPNILFDSVSEIHQAMNNIYATRIQPLLNDYAAKVRVAIFAGDSMLRRELHCKCDELGAKITADIIHSVLTLYKACPSDSTLNISEQFSNIDEEGLPVGYFIDRDDSDIFQGYATVEGHYPRGLDLRLTPGLQLRLSATGNSEVRWKQSIVNSILITPATQYCLKASAYAIDATGCNGLRILLYDDCYSVKDKITIEFDNGTGWRQVEYLLEVDKKVNAVGIEFFSSNNSGTILVDNWQLSNEFVAELKPAVVDDKKLKLALKPTDGYYLKDESSFANQNEPIVSIRDNMAVNIASGDELIFDGKSFVEIPWHPLYTPLQVADTLELGLMLCPESPDGEIMMSAIFMHKPMSGWRLFLKEQILCVAVYHENSEYLFETTNSPLGLDEWHSINLKITPDNEIIVSLAGNIVVGQADFSRKYSNSAHFIGSCAGVNNFLTGKIKNLYIRGNCKSPARA